MTALTVTVGELRSAEEPDNALVYGRGKLIVVVDGARLLALGRREQVVLYLHAERERHYLARVVKVVGRDVLPE